KPDIVFAPYLVSNGLTAALSWKGPLVVSAVGGDVDDYMNRKGLRRILREETIRFICRRADIVNTVSQHLDDILIRIGVPAEKLLQIPYGVDLDTFHPAPEMPRSEATRLICTRKHERLYDIPTVIDALAKLKSTGRKFHCTITCGGTRWEENKTRAKAAGLQEEEVTFTGNLPHQEIPGLLRQADIYIASTYFDGTSVALLEAMASGLLPVVTRINANIPWIEEGKTGLLFEPGEVDQLAEALAKAMDDTEMRKNIFEENRLRVDRDANMKRNHDRLYQAFEEIVAKHRR
ncbi:MAG: glycosyltransferase family 4 protein, partial [Planctomycetota bacterium]